MAEVTIKTVLEGVAEAQRSLATIGKQMNALRKATQDQTKASRDSTSAAKEQANTFDKVKDHLGAMITRYGKVAIAIEVMRRVIMASIAAHHASRESQIRLQATLRATGNVVGYTSSQIEEYVGSLRQMTQFSRSALREGASQLLIFRTIQGETFKRALKSSADLASFMRTDFPNAARLLGRALDDPVRGFGVLTRVLGRLGDEEKRQITIMLENGRLMEAQQYILDILDGKIGDLSDTINRDAVTGFAHLKRALNEVANDSAWGGLADWIAEATSKVVEFANQAAKLPSTIGKAAIQNLMKQLSPEEYMRKSRLTWLLAAREREEAEDKSAAAIEKRQLEMLEAMRVARFNYEDQVLANQIEMGMRSEQERLARTNKEIALYETLKDMTNEEKQQYQSLITRRIQSNARIVALHEQAVDLIMAVEKKPLEYKLASVQKELEVEQMSAARRIALRRQEQALKDQIFERDMKNLELRAEAMHAEDEQLAKDRQAYARMWMADTERQMHALDLLHAPYDVIITKLQILQEQAAAAADTEEGRAKGALEAYTDLAKRIKEVTEAHEDQLWSLRRGIDLTIDYGEKLKNLQALLGRGWINEQQFKDAFKKLNEELDSSAGNMSEWQRQMLDATQGFGTEFTNQMNEMLMTGKAQWKDFRNTIISLFNKAILHAFITVPLQNAIQDVINTMQRGINHVKAGGGGFFEQIVGGISSVFTGFSGGYLPSGSYATLPGGGLAGPFQHGGVIPKGFTGLVGEAGPELITPAGASRITPNSEFGGGKVTIEQHFHSGVSRAELVQILPRLKADTVAAVLEAKRSGGRFSNAF